jgi:hypothetical protein
MKKVPITVAAPAALLFPLFLFAQSGAEGGLSPGQPCVGFAVHSDLSKPLREMKPRPSTSIAATPERVKSRPENPIVEKAPPKSPSKDTLLQEWEGFEAMPSPALSFAGVGNVNHVLPPDTNGDVGPDHYVQWVNLSLAVWDKQGSRILGPVDGNVFWDGFGGPCDTCNDGDPIVLYDRLADRWLISQFAIPSGNGPFYQYLAVSQTGDPTGAYYRYAFKYPNSYFGDYPKFGVWPTAYVMTANQFGSGWAGVGVLAFDRAKMLAGSPSASYQYFNLGSVDNDYAGVLPVHFEGTLAPPDGANALLIGLAGKSLGFSSDSLDVWEFKLDWYDPFKSRFGDSGKPNVRISIAPFDANLCNWYPCVPQPGTPAKLDTLSSFLMYKAQYRNYAEQESVAVAHTVDGDGNSRAGVRWYELRRQGEVWTVANQGTYSPSDGLHRWMPSAGMDHAGNFAVGYSVSSSTVHPSIRYAGRLASDPADELSQGEAELVAGGGSQTSQYERWGDYSSMSIDPSDDCTFWYTQEYMKTTSSSGWSTRIGTFTFPGCAVSAAGGPAQSSGSVPFTASFTSSPSGGRPPYTVEWDFGDGSPHSSDLSPTHTYTQVGTYEWTLTVRDALSLSASAGGEITVTVPPPLISSVVKKGNPYRLALSGSNFHVGCTVKVNGTDVPQTVFKSATSLQAKGGSALKALLPKGVPAQITVVNNDDGGVSAAFTFTP